MRWKILFGLIGVIQFTLVGWLLYVYFVTKTIEEVIFAILFAAVPAVGYAAYAILKKRWTEPPF